MGSVDPKSRGAVLVVDDDEDLRGQLREALEYQHYFVVEAEDGIDALEVLRSNYAPVIRLVILDLVMPFMTGWEFVNVLRRDPALSPIPVVIASGVPVHGDASGIGATMVWLRKPFDEEALLAAVERAMSGASPGEDDEAPAGTPAGRRTVPSHSGH
jgi:two-component system chemotaxis response regulator CheY